MEKWFFIDREVKILKTINIFNISKVLDIENSQIYFVDNSFLTNYKKEPEKSINITLLGSLK